MTKDNLRLFQGRSNPSITKDAIRQLREELPTIIEFYSIYAEMIHAKFEALKSQGFTQEQALELCKTL
jgi:hypothetical protein